MYLGGSKKEFWFAYYLQESINIRLIDNANFVFLFGNLPNSKSNLYPTLFAGKYITNNDQLAPCFRQFYNIAIILELKKIISISNMKLKKSK